MVFFFYNKVGYQWYMQFITVFLVEFNVNFESHRFCFGNIYFGGEFFAKKKVFRIKSLLICKLQYQNKREEIGSTVCEVIIDSWD